MKTSSGWQVWIGALGILAWVMAPWSQWPLLFVGAGSVGFFLLREHPRLAVPGALVAGYGQVAWVGPAVVLSGKPGALGITVAVGLLQSLGPLFAVWFASFVWRRLPSIWAWALAWMVAQGVAELICPLPALHAALAAEQSWVLWPAAVGGPALVTGALALFGALVVRRPVRGLLAVGLYLGIGAGLSSLPSPGRPLTAAVIQPDLHALDARPSLAPERQDLLLALMESAEAELYALPEGAWPHDPGEREGSRREAFQRALAGKTVVTGANVGDPPTNSLVSAPSFGRVDKVVLVPGWERSLFGYGRDRYRPGAGGAILVEGDLRIGALICYEDVVWSRVERAGAADLLVAATNDSWNGPGAGSRLHLAQARLAAVSTGLWTLRPAMNGPSAILSPWGEAVWRAPWVEDGPGRIGVATITVGPSWRPGRWGRWTVWLWGLVLLVWLGRAR